MEAPFANSPTTEGTALHHSLERLDSRVRHSEAALVMVEHGVPTPVLRVFQLLKDRPIERLTDTEHKAFAGTDDWLIADYKFGVCASLHLRFANHLQAA